jgi:hypothetical protein
VSRWRRLRLTNLTLERSPLTDMTTELPLTIVQNGLLVGRHTVISFNRTLRIPEDGRRYNLPAGFGRLPIVRVEDVADRVPKKWRDEGGLIIPLYQREALFLEFKGVKWRPTISKVSVGRVNAITAKPHDFQLKKGRQDYVVIPVQKWLDGVNSGDGTVRQFVAMPLGQGYTVEAQVTDEETSGGFQLVIYEPKPGVFTEPKQPEWIAPSRRPLESRAVGGVSYSIAPACAPVEMGIAAGGMIKQQILEDEYGIHSWDEDARIALNVHIVNSAVFSDITGQPPPPSPVTAKAYMQMGVPWFRHYEESRRGVSAPKVFKKLLSVFQIDKARGNKQSEAVPANIADGPVVAVKTLTLPERLNSLHIEAVSAFKEGRHSEALQSAKLCGELLDRHRSEVKLEKLSTTTSSLAAEMFAMAGQCAVNLKEFPEAEDLANRSLLLAFSEQALTIRMFSRSQTAQIEDALADCDELLQLNPKHEFAKSMHSRLKSALQGE